jgi:RNA polymerase sigma-70 factor (ECF subfamily)
MLSGNDSLTVEYRRHGIDGRQAQSIVDEQQPDDQTLMMHIAQRNEAALAALYDRYGGLVVSIAYHLLGRRETAEDVALEVFTRVWEHGHTYDAGRGQVRTWLANITRHRAIDVLRRESVRPESTAVGWSGVGFEPAVEASSPESLADRSWQQQRVRAAVAALPKEQQAALALAYFQGLTHREIAAKLGEPLGTVKGRIRAAMHKLRDSLQDEQ